MVAIVFAAVAVALGVLDGGVSTAVPELGGDVVVPPGALTTDSPRTPLLSHPPRITLGGYLRSCQDCHALLDPGEHALTARGETARVQHGDVVLEHGLNDRCLVCHHPADRDVLTLLDGTKITFDETPRLCRQCHGLVGRDWERGVHGRTHGSWVTGSPEQRRLECTECHDPHAPAFPSYAPLPAPDTLRLPDKEHRAPHATEPRWPRSAIEAARGDRG